MCFDVSCNSISVIIPSYKRAWALNYSLSSLVDQVVLPDEVIIVLRPSQDGSEDVVRKFSRKLPIKLIFQKEGNVTDAIYHGMKNASGNILLFMDDDAIAEEKWTMKYQKLFAMLEQAGGIAGMTLPTHLIDGLTIKYEHHPLLIRNMKVPSYGKPLKGYENYCGYVSKSGFLINASRGEILSKACLNAVFVGVNMGFLRDAIIDCPIGRFFKTSRKCYSFESFLAYWARKKGYHTYVVTNIEDAPIVWHLEHKKRLTNIASLQDKFWFGYDVFMNYFRYRKVGADISLKSYILACLAFTKKNIPIHLLSLIYALLSLKTG